MERKYTVRLVEIIKPDVREYRYYVFDGTYIIAGFNNHADLSAIRLRYGAEWRRHRYEPIPHLHLKNKKAGACGGDDMPAVPGLDGSKSAAIDR